MILKKIFYILKPLIPRHIQIALRRQLAGHKGKKYANIWPIDPNAGESPKDWNGLPEGKKFSLVLTHDEDTQKGHDRCYDLMKIEEELGFWSSFNFVPERYKVSLKLINDIKKKGFEVGVHGLKHDGKLYASKNIFNERAKEIKYYLKEWKAVGFRSPAMHHKLDWIQDLNIKYYASTFDTDPFEPQSDGVGTIFPFLVTNKNNRHGYVELPYTLVQDFTLFVLLKEQTTSVWKRKLDWIVKKKGMALLNTHPDYMQFSNGKPHIQEYPIKLYRDFLVHLKTDYHNEYWNVVPKEIADALSTKMNTEIAQG